MKVLSKSRFKLGLECPNKLYFTSKKEYANQKNEDTFLKALAQGGFQVEELARMHYPVGVFIDAEHYEYEKAVELTNEVLTNDNVVIFEAAFLYDGLFIRTDILEKKGNKIRLIEVKAKSYKPDDDYFFIGKKGGIHTGWKPYLFDLAYQKYVVHKAFPDYNISAWLLLADKSKQAQVNGLNQAFRIPKDGDPRTDIIKKVSSMTEIGESVLSEINVDGIIEDILTNKHLYHETLPFQDAVKLFKDAYQQDKFLRWDTNFSVCKNCEYKATEEDKNKCLLSGFEYCFKKLRNWSDIDFKKPNAFEIWNFRGQKLMDDDNLFLKDIDEDDLKVKVKSGRISQSERQMIQVEKSRDNDDSIYCLKEELNDEISKWKFPLHFIDFETSAVALPFHEGRVPYEQIAFQFSHHQYNEDGSIQHIYEYINSKAGEFPNFEFARALKATLDKDDGSIFRYATHENTILNHIIVQLENSNEPDKTELIDFFKIITYKKRIPKDYEWVGDRAMIDLRKVYVDYIYNPLTGGSNSLKFVLPACLNSSDYLKTKYRKPISDIGITSKNFDNNHVWISQEDGTVINPYKLLPNLFEDWTDKQLDDVIGEIDNIADGGAALMAYAKLQYYDMTEEERNELTKSLLKYCELDTLAMVMLYEHFRFDLLKD